MVLNQMYLYIVCLLYLIQYSYTQRRIVGGLPAAKDKPFTANKYAYHTNVDCAFNQTWNSLGGSLVYLIEANNYPTRYYKWLCGGAIVSRSYILTSAACIKDVDHCYAIAGYRHYVSSDDVNTDNCTQRMKKKIVGACVPNSFPSLNKTDLNAEKWTHNDIALAKVDVPFNFTDTSYTIYCSYLPEMLKINYDLEKEKYGNIAYVYGWGHLNQFEEDDAKEIPDNVKDLRYATVQLMDKEICKKYYVNHEIRLPGLDEFMICTYGDGKVDSSNSNNMNIGICQNDHGGPLVVETEAEDVLIGIASHFRVTKNKTCIGPFLFTSTARNMKFLKCVLMQERRSGRLKEICEKTELRI